MSVLSAKNQLQIILQIEVNLFLEVDPVWTSITGSQSQHAQKSQKQDQPEEFAGSS